MWIATYFAACAVFAQQSPLADGLTPYQFTFTNNDPELFAFVNEADLDEISIPVIVDEPWHKRAYPITLQRLFINEMEPEPSALRKARLQREWEAAGGVETTDRAGNPYWVLQSDLDKQARAERMIDAAFPAMVETQPLDTASRGELIEGGAKGPGFLRLWGPHAAIATAAVLLCGGVSWLTFRRSWSPL